MKNVNNLYSTNKNKIKFAFHFIYYEIVNLVKIDFFLDNNFDIMLEVSFKPNLIT